MLTVIRGPRFEKKMSNDPQYSNIPLLTTFLKSFQRPYLGAESLSLEMAMTNEEDELVPASYREKFRKVFTDYFKAASKVLVKGHTVCVVDFSCSRKEGQLMTFRCRVGVEIT
jgi:hypothetical protein